MARNITVATISPAGLQIDWDQPMQKAVDQMIEYWQGRLAQVLPDQPDLIVLPEVGDTPATDRYEQRFVYYKVRKDQMLDFFTKVAARNKCYIAYSAARDMQDGTWRNSTWILDRSGNVAGIYNKNHLTFGEHENNILCGKDASLIECDFGRVACVTCFDLNFNELRLKYVEARPDLLVFCSMYHGGLMQAYWAYSCRCHFVGSVNYGSPSEIRNPFGEVIDSTSCYRDFAVAQINLDCCMAHLDFNREQKLPALKKKYGRDVNIYTPASVGSVLISSRSDAVSAKQMAKEFDIELLDDYFARALAMRHSPGAMEK